MPDRPVSAGPRTRRLEVRKVVLDFSEAKVHWNPNEPEFCQLLNAVSACLPVVEPFLIKAVRKAKAGLADQNGDLARDVDLFVGQEARHYRLHSQFNRKLEAEGYTWLADDVARLQRGYDGFLADRSPEFALAYAEGFETFGPLAATFLFEGAEDLFTDGDEATVYLWLWHFAEEYEHRTVCNYLFKEVCGSYRIRMGGLFYLHIHLFRWVAGVTWKLIQQDRREGRIKGRWRSNLRLARVIARIFAQVLPRLVFRATNPRYDPAGLRPPRGAMALLAAASERYGVAAP